MDELAPSLNKRIRLPPITDITEPPVRRTHSRLDTLLFGNQLILETLESRLERIHSQDSDSEEEKEGFERLELGHRRTMGFSITLDTEHEGLKADSSDRLNRIVPLTNGQCLARVERPSLPLPDQPTTNSQDRGFKKLRRVVNSVRLANRFRDTHSKRLFSGSARSAAQLSSFRLSPGGLAYKLCRAVKLGALLYFYFYIQFL